VQRRRKGGKGKEGKSEMGSRVERERGREEKKEMKERERNDLILRSVGFSEIKII
jgi:hypothetical protein